MSKKSGPICKRCGAAKLPDKNGRLFCPCRYRAKISITCDVCGRPFTTTPKRVPRKKYCSRRCAHLGQPRTRVHAWNNGLTKDDHESMQRVADAVRENYLTNPERGRGVNHPFYGKKHSPEAKAAMSAARRTQTVTPGMLRGLAVGQQSRKGKTKETCESIARASLTRKARPFKSRPQHGPVMRAFYDRHPEKHPNRILAKRGYETKPEKAMRLALDRGHIHYTRQHRVGRRYIDFAISAAKIAIEVDGLYWHPHGPDKDRDKELNKAGWRVVHFTDSEVFADSSACVLTISSLLNSGRDSFS